VSEGISIARYFIADTYESDWPRSLANFFHVQVNSPPAKPSRRFSLRTMMIYVSAIAIAAAFGRSLESGGLSLGLAGPFLLGTGIFWLLAWIDRQRRMKFDEGEAAWHLYLFGGILGLLDLMLLGIAYFADMPATGASIRLLVDSLLVIVAAPAIGITNSDAVFFSMSGTTMIAFQIVAMNWYRLQPSSKGSSDPWIIVLLACIGFQLFIPMMLVNRRWKAIFRKQCEEREQATAEPVSKLHA
jgi:hypothetical protein